MPALAEIQREMRRSLAGDDASVAAFIVGDRIDAAARLGIHRGTFESVATRALRLNYPAVAKLVGEDFFAATARAYVAEHPPASAWLDRYGAGFPGFLSRWKPAAELAYLPDVARLEWSVTRALHAPDAPALDARSLATAAALAGCKQRSIRFTRHPSLRLLRTRSPADAIWRATLAGDDDALAAIDPHAGPRWLVVARTPRGIDVVALSETAWRFMRDLALGRPLHAARSDAEALEDTGALEGAELLEDAEALGAQLAAGRFTALRVANDTSASEPEETSR